MKKKDKAKVRKPFTKISKPMLIYDGRYWLQKVGNDWLLYENDPEAVGAMHFRSFFEVADYVEQMMC